jgi:ketosteroid isomerase-like protein
MSDAKRAVAAYMEAYRSLDHARILACLTDDVECLIPGAFHVRGKPTFDREIESDEFLGAPEIDVARLVEEGEVVVAEGTVRARRKDGAVWTLAFCDVFEKRGDRIRRLTSYLARTA